MGLDDDHPLEGKWFCIRCETERSTVRRYNASYVTAMGFAIPLNVAVWIQGYPFLKDQIGPAFGLLLLAVLAFGYASLLLDVLNKAAFTAVCTSCTSPEVVPLNSPRAKRVLGEARAVSSTVSDATSRTQPQAPIDLDVARHASTAGDPEEPTEATATPDRAAEEQRMRV
jgi:hypothetical protein